MTVVKGHNKVHRLTNPEKPPIPKTEGAASYKNCYFHFRAFIEAICKSLIFALLITPSIGLSDVVTDPVTGAQVRDSCESYDLRISTASEYEDRIRITRVAEEPDEFVAVTPFWEPDRESYFKLLAPDFTVAPVGVGWNSYVFISTDDKNYFRLAIAGHGSGGVRPYWQDSTTLAFEVWWGRISETHFLIETRSGEIFNFQDRDHFEATLPCRE